MEYKDFQDKYLKGYYDFLQYKISQRFKENELYFFVNYKENIIAIFDDGVYFSKLYECPKTNDDGMPCGVDLMAAEFKKIKNVDINQMIRDVKIKIETLNENISELETIKEKFNEDAYQRAIDEKEYEKLRIKLGKE